MERNDIITEDPKTLYCAARRLFVALGYMVRLIGRSIQPDYWICMFCGHVEWKEQEVLCWKCNGAGEMIYKGDL